MSWPVREWEILFFSVLLKWTAWLGVAKTDIVKKKKLVAGLVMSQYPSNSEL